MKIEEYEITTGMGIIYHGISILTFLNVDELAELNNIGYTGKKIDGIKCTRTEYLNSLGKGKFSVQQTKYDNGDYSEAFTIVRTIEDEVKPITIDVAFHIDEDGTKIYDFEGMMEDFKCKLSALDVNYEDYI